MLLQMFVARYQYFPGTLVDENSLFHLFAFAMLGIAMPGSFLCLLNGLIRLINSMFFIMGDGHESCIVFIACSWFIRWIFTRRRSIRGLEICFRWSFVTCFFCLPQFQHFGSLSFEMKIDLIFFLVLRLSEKISGFRFYHLVLLKFVEQNFPFQQLFSKKVSTSQPWFLAAFQLRFSGLKL